MKRVLIICYYWPPAGGPGVQRWLKFVKYFRDFGIEPVMFVPEKAHYPSVDAALEKEIPANIEILRTPINEPYRFAKVLSKKQTRTISRGIISEKDPSFMEKLMLFTRGNFFIPDARVGWVKPSVSFLRKYLQQETIDAIITTGPPHSLHLIGLQLKKELNLPWIVDFRDPWTSIHYHKSLRLTKAAAQKHKELEKDVLNAADHVVVTSPGTEQEFRGITDRPISVITNGYDRTEIKVPLDPDFTIVHVGSLLNERNPEILWKTLSELVNEDPEFAAHCKIRLVGNVGSRVLESLTEFQLSDRLEQVGYVENHKALEHMRRAQVLLLIEKNSEETKAIIPGKLFEYLNAHRSIIALGPQGSDIEEIMKDTQAGEFFNYSQGSQLKTELKQLFAKFHSGSLEASTQNIEKYSRKALTAQMADLIKSL